MVADRGTRVSSGHIRIDKDLSEDTRVWRLADQLLEHLSGQLPVLTPETRNALRGVTRNAALGALVKLWRYADHYISEDDALPTALHELAEVVSLPVEVLRSFPPEWLREMPDGRVRLPDYTAKNALNAKEKRRAQSRERVRRWREKKALEEAGKSGPVSSSGPDLGNALHSVTSNARNAPSRAGARAGIPETDTETITRNPLSPLGRGKSGRNGRDVRSESARAWDRVLDAVQHGQSTVDDPKIDQAVRRIGGYHALGQAQVSQRAENRRRFREALEELLVESAGAAA